MGREGKPSRLFPYVPASRSMNRIVLLAPALLLAACSQEASQPSEPAIEASSVPPAAAGTATAPAVPAFVSRYTRLDDCKTVRTRDDEDWAVLRCQGQGGIGLTLNYADARDDLELVRPGKPPIQIGLPNLAGGGFNKLGDTIEWRGTGDGAAFTPLALIVRNNAIENAEMPERSTSFLAVIDLAQGCALAHVRPGEGQNERARKIADTPGQPCLRPGTVQE